MPNRLRGIFLVPFFIFTLFASAQVNTVSPYSRLGAGDLAAPDFARAIGFGGANLALYDPMNINLNNPASYSALALTTFELGVQVGLLEQRQQSPDFTIRNYSAGLRYFAVGVPLYTWWGSALVLKPYSFKGYNISSNRFLADSTAVLDNSQGSGGLNQLVWGNAFEVAEGLSLGINTAFVFGRLEESNSTVFNGAQLPYDTRSVYSDNIRGFTVEGGAQYHLALANNRELGLGLTFSNRATLNANTNRTIYTYQTNASGQEFPIDSLTVISNRESTFALPGNFGVGVSYGKTNELTFTHSWLISADFEQRMGSQFSDVLGSNQGLQNGFRAEFGGVITPRLAFEKLERSNNFLSKVEYRIGAFYERTPLNLNGNAIDDYGMTIGFGLPIRQKSLAPGEVKASTINTGIVLGRRGTLSDGLIQENYLNFFIGVTLNDKWFIKYKYR